MLVTTKYGLLLGVNKNGGHYIRVTMDDFTPYEKLSVADQGPQIVLVSVDDEMTVEVVEAFAMDTDWDLADGDEQYFVDEKVDGEEEACYMPTRLDIVFNELLD
jgi:hypothetical protein